MTPRLLRLHYQALFDEVLNRYMKGEILKKELRKAARMYFPLIDMYHKQEIGREVVCQR